MHAPQQLFFIISFHLCIIFPFLCVTAVHRDCSVLPHEHGKNSKQIILNHMPSNSNQHQSRREMKRHAQPSAILFPGGHRALSRWCNGNREPDWHHRSAQEQLWFSLLILRGLEIAKEEMLSWKSCDCELISITNHSTSLGKDSSAVKEHKKLPRNAQIQLYGLVEGWRSWYICMCTLVF